MGENEMRADAALAARGLAGSREKARALIEAGLATVNGAAIKKPAQKVGGDDVLAVLGAAHPYVSRGGLKLEKALRVFGIEAEGRVCMDIGASTGGFTDVLLQSGAHIREGGKTGNILCEGIVHLIGYLDVDLVHLALEDGFLACQIF